MRGGILITSLNSCGFVAPFREGRFASLHRPQGALGFGPPYIPQEPHTPLKRPGLQPGTRGLYKQVSASFNQIVPQRFGIAELAAKFLFPWRSFP